MRLWKFVWVIAMASIAAAACSIGGCGERTDGADRELDPVVRTTFYPTTYFAERISGGLVPVELPLPPGEDPIFWRPSPEAIGAYQDARLIVLNGAEFEKWAIAAPLPRSRVVESITVDGLEGGPIMIEGVTHSHGPAGEHTHDGIDGHTWVDPLNAMSQAETIAEAMAAAFPEHADAFGENVTRLRLDLRGLHDRLEGLGEAAASATLLASHPAYDYLARRHGWTVTSFDLDPAAPLTDEAIAELAAGLRSLPSGGGRVVLLWESEPLDGTVARLGRELGVVSVLFTPAETLDPSDAAAGEDYLSIMHANIDRLEAALGVAGGRPG